MSLAERLARAGSRRAGRPAVGPRLGLVLLLLAAGTQAFGARCLTRIGVWSIPGDEHTAQQWVETAQYLSAKISNCAFSVVPLTREQLLEKVQRNALDFVIAGPAACVELESLAGAQIVATVETRYKASNYALGGGTLFCLGTRADINRPADVRHKLVATVHERSLEDWLSAVREFKAAGINPRKDFDGVLFLGNPEEVVTAVLSGRVDAGCVRAGTLEQMAADHGIDLARLRVLSFETTAPANAWKKIPVAVSTRLYPRWCLAACPRASSDLVKEVAAVLLTMRIASTEGSRGPRTVGWTSPPSVLPVHECLQELRLSPYEHFGEISISNVVRQYMYWFIVIGAWIIVLSMILWYSAALNRALTAEVGERKKAETSLRESVQRFEHVAQSSGEWIWEADIDGRYTYSNHIVQQMLGYAPQEIMGKRFLDLLTTAERERLATQGQMPLKSATRTTSERYRMRTKDGRVVIHESTAAPITSVKGAHIGYRGVNRDITNQVRFVQLRI
ncbi:MAG: PhnD/SsuA/transferrin family substrate-binding protein [Verrucomicrobiota bacterium]